MSIAVSIVCIILPVIFMAAVAGTLILTYKRRYPPATFTDTDIPIPDLSGYTPRYNPEVDESYEDFERFKQEYDHLMGEGHWRI